MCECVHSSVSVCVCGPQQGFPAREGTEVGWRD